MGLGLLQSHGQHLHFGLIDVGHDDYRFSKKLSSVPDSHISLRPKHTSRQTTHSHTLLWTMIPTVQPVQGSFSRYAFVYICSILLSINTAHVHHSLTPTLGLCFCFVFLHSRRLFTHDTAHKSVKALVTGSLGTYLQVFGDDAETLHCWASTTWNVCKRHEESVSCAASTATETLSTERSPLSSAQRSRARCLKGPVLL